MTSRYSTASTLRRLRGLVFLVSLLFAGSASAQGGAVLGPSLQSALADAAPSAQLEVIVTYGQDGPLTPSQTAVLSALGVSGVTMQALPIAGVLATPAQVAALAQADGVRSVWLNEPVEFYNGDAREITGVEKVRTDPAFRTAMGLPYSGKGVGVVVHDSGVDGTHPDLQLGQNLVQNVLGSQNLGSFRSLTGQVVPVTYLEDQLNTDTNSGHGTHVAGTVGGTGAASGGLHAGVAPGADLIGYGSGGVLLVLDTIGGFDYALTHQFQYGIRVITNSWGGGNRFDPTHPVNEASYRAFQRGIVTLFSASNSGPGADTHNLYAQAPWVISVGAANKNGTLADFSSRGKKGESGTFQTYDGQTWTYVNEPTVVAPGVDIISACSTGSPLCALGIQQDNPRYTSMQGTSMSCPHVAGIVALMLEADPLLSPADVKRILMETATNMPGRESWEVGAGFVNAYAAMTVATGQRADFGATVNATRTFNSGVDIVVTETPLSVDYNPLPVLSADGNVQTFVVPEGLSLITATVSAEGILGETGNPIYPVLIAPDGTEYSAGTTLLFPLEYNRVQTVSNPMPGEWTVEIRGIQNGTGQNVVSFPEQVEGTLAFARVNGLVGAGDIAGHPAAGAIEGALGARLLDGFADGTMRPDAPLTRGQLAEYLVMGGAIRQALPIDGSITFGDVPASLAPFAEAVSVRGGALRDGRQRFDPVVRSAGSAFDPSGTVTRAELAYSLVQTLAGQGLASEINASGADVTVRFGDEVIVLDDQHEIPAELRGYVQIALELGVLNARFAVSQGPFDLEPTITATFSPNEPVSRGQYAVSAFAAHQHYLAGVSYAAGSAGDQNAALPALAQTATSGDGADVFDLAASAPNPVASASRIAFSLAEAGPARLAVYDLLGREVAVLADGTLEAGAHEVRLDASGLATGAYVYRLTAGDQSLVRQLTVVR
jgi:serine protease AprX